MVGIILLIASCSLLITFLIGYWIGGRHTILNGDVTGQVTVQPYGQLTIHGNVTASSTDYGIMAVTTKLGSTVTIVGNIACND